MIAFDGAGLKREGFVGFVSVSILGGPRGLDVLPRDPGVYALLREAPGAPRFIDPGTGGWFKGTDPNVRLRVLNTKWVAAASVVYIGMASSLQQRLGQLIKFGQGRNIGHKGGRYLWQLADSRELLVAWQIHSHPAGRESELLRDYVELYGAFPFANLRW